LAGSSNEGRCCDAVLRVLEEREDSSRRILSVDSPKSPGVELRCSIGDRIFALEHTTLDPYPNRRADDQRLLAIVVPIEESIEAAGLLSPGRRYTLTVDGHALRNLKRSEFAGVTKRLETWVIENVARLDRASGERRPYLRASPPVVPCQVGLSSFDASSPGPGKLRIARFAPENLEDQRRARLATSVRQKGPKLHAEHASGATSVLVLEDFDIAISNEILIAEALFAALDAVEFNIDEIYVVDTSLDSVWDVLALQIGDDRWPTDYESPPRWEFAPNALIDVIADTEAK